MENSSQKTYFNAAQQYLLFLAPRILYLIASRRFGKSEGVIMPILLRNVQSMPRGLHAIVARSYKQALTRTLPATFRALARLGYVENVHYYVGRQAPKNSGFKLPLIKPSDWSYSIHWYNGSVCPIISQDVAFSSNSLTLSSLIADEAKTLIHEKLTDELFPAITPLPEFQNIPWDGSRTFVSDMPSGGWLLDKKDEMDTELVELLGAMIYELYRLKRRIIPGENNSTIRKKVEKLRQEINVLRSQTTVWAAYSILENIELVGEQYIKDMIRDLPPAKLLTSIASMQFRHTVGGFYAALTDALFYTSSDISFLNSFRKKDNSIDWQKAAQAKWNCASDTDIDSAAPLYIAADTNVNINWLVIGQPDHKAGKLRVLNSIFVKHPAMLNELIEKFAAYYKPLKNRSIVFYYDQTFLQGRSAHHAEAFHQTITNGLRSKKFNVIPAYVGLAMRHNMKHKEIDDALKGKRLLQPIFNRENNYDLINGLEDAKTKITKNGFEKNKTAEKDPDSIDNPVEWRTDGTDAFDTLFIGCNFFPQFTASSHSSVYQK